MFKVRLGALATAGMIVGMWATPAAAHNREVERVRDKDAILVVTDCPAQGPAGLKCLAFSIVAARHRERSDGSVTRDASLRVEKFRVTLTETSFRSRSVAVWVNDSVQLNVADDLSTATGHGKVNHGTIDVAFALTANAPVDVTRTRDVQRFDDCRIIERQRSQSRTADGGAIINGKTYGTAVATAVGFISTIDVSGSTTISRGDCP
jgi:hypothetical protein